MLKNVKEIKTVAKGILEEMTDLESRLSWLSQSAQNAGINYEFVGISLYTTSKSKTWLEQFVNDENSYDDKKAKIEESLCSIEMSVRNVRHVVEQGGNIDKSLDFILEKVKNIENIVQSGRYE